MTISPHIRIEGFIVSQLHPEIIAKALVEEAFEKGSCDNITALIVTFHQQPDEDSQAASST